MSDLLTFTDFGIYCPRADAYIDPWKPVDRAIITHAHSDHARWGSTYYLANTLNQTILKLRLGDDINLELMDYGSSRDINGVKFSFHPAGHIWGSSQVRVEYKGDVWVVSGDYKVESDGFSGDFEPVKCNTFITESTFGLPVFKWKKQQEVISQIDGWWRKNASHGKASILCAYALGKAQRLIYNVDSSIGEIFVHGAVYNVNEALTQAGAKLPPTTYATNDIDKSRYTGALIVTPSSALGTSWLRKFQPYEVATVSGWMNIRGIKRRRNAGMGFVMSDHADWDGLNQAVAETGAERVLVTHGYTDAYARWLRSQGLESEVVETLYEGETPDA
jgi:putative mRNA 3-end processing factor